MSRFLILLGVLLIIVGIFFPYLQKLGLGRLHGDILIKRGGFVFYFPIVTSILISVILTFLFWFLNRH